MTNQTYRKTVWTIVLLGLILSVLILVGCAGRHYASSTDRKTDQGPEYWPKYIEGVGFCECWEDKTGLAHCHKI